MRKGQTVPVSLRLTSDDEGYNNFISDLRRKQKMSSLLSDLLLFYYKDENLQQMLTEFLLKENEFYANVTTQFQNLVDTHKTPVSNVSGVPLDQLIGLISDISNATKPQTALIQQINPMGYGQPQVQYGQPQGQYVPQQGHYVQQVPQQQLAHYTQEPEQYQQQQINPMVEQQVATSPTSGAVEQATQGRQTQVNQPVTREEVVEPVKQDIFETEKSAPMGLFDDSEDNEDELEDNTVKPASFNKLLKSIKK